MIKRWSSSIIMVSSNHHIPLKIFFVTIIQLSQNLHRYDRVWLYSISIKRVRRLCGVLIKWHTHHCFQLWYHSRIFVSNHSSGKQSACRKKSISQIAVFAQTFCWIALDFLLWSNLIGNNQSYDFIRSSIFLTDWSVLSPFTNINSSIVFLSFIRLSTVSIKLIIVCSSL